MSSKPSYRSRTDIARAWLIRVALEPEPWPRTIHAIAQRVGCSRTPVTQALWDLTNIGLFNAARYANIQPTFAGADDIQERAMTLFGALATGRKGSTLSAVACGRWAELSWEVLRAWPSSAHRWGLDLRPKAPEIRRAEAQFEAEVAAGNLFMARTALLLWSDLVTTNPHGAPPVVARQAYDDDPAASGI